MVDAVVSAQRCSERSGGFGERSIDAGGGGGGGEGSTGGRVVGTPVYNTSGCEIDPQQCRCFFHHTTPQHTQLMGTKLV